MRRGRRGKDGGETLIELLATIAIMGTAVLVIIGATGTAIHLSDIHRKQATAGAYMRAFAEAIEARVADSPTGYVSCTTPNIASTYNGYYAAPIAPYGHSVTGVKVWTGTAFGPLTGCTDLGVQQVSLKVTLTGQADETLTIVIRRPCRPIDTSDTSCS
jgi:type II secretory pathway pseudopilin PulG